MGGKVGCLGLAFSIILVVVGMILVLGTDVAVPFLEPIFCPENDTLIRETSPSYDDDGSGENVDYYCIDDDGGARTNMGGQLMLVVFALFAPMIFFILLLTLGGGNKTRQQAMQMLQNYASTTDGSTVDLRNMPNADKNAILQEILGAQMTKLEQMQPNQQLTLKQKLLQLRDAYDEGLIDGNEYERRKEAILDDLIED